MTRALTWGGLPNAWELGGLPRRVERLALLDAFLDGDSQLSLSPELRAAVRPLVA